MNWGAWKRFVFKPDDKLAISDLRGSSTPFNGVNFGLLLVHGTYGTSPDYAANQCRQMYFPIASGGSATYLRMSGMNLGGAGGSGLKWMAIFSCFSLYNNNWQNMQNAGIHPYNSNLRLFLGCSTEEYATGGVMGYFAR
jgi:hypothetical protein